MLSNKGNIPGIVSVLLFKNGLSSTQINSDIQLGVNDTNLYLEENVITEGPLTCTSSLFVSGVSQLQGAITGSSTLNISGNTTINATLEANQIKQNHPAPGTASLLVPTGSVMAFAASSAPGGWLLCDGSNISRTTYSALFAAIGTTYGVGDGSTTFTLPNIKGRVIVGYNSAETEFNSLGETGGAKTHTLTIDEIPAHTHTYQNNVNDQNTDNAFGTETAADQADINQTTGSTGGGQPHNNLQPYIVLNYIIKV